MKQLLICLAVICSFNFVQAQSTTNYYDRMNQIFGLIDKTKVTTGFLKEFGIRFNCIESYNGILGDTNYVDLTQWKSLYNSLYSMRVGTVASSMTVPSTVFCNAEIRRA